MSLSGRLRFLGFIVFELGRLNRSVRNSGAARIRYVALQRCPEVLRAQERRGRKENEGQEPADLKSRR